MVELPTESDPVKVIEGDCLDVLRSLPDGCVDAVITSPPYGVGMEYESGGYAEWLGLMYSFFAASAPAVKPGGVVAVVVGDVRCHPDQLLPPVRAETPGRQNGVTAQDIIDAAIAGKGRTKAELARALGVSEQTIDRRLLGNNARGCKQEPQTRVRLVGSDLDAAARAAGLYLYDARVWVKDPCWESCEYHATSLRAVDESEHVYVWTHAGAPPAADRTRLERGEWVAWGSRGVWRVPSVRRSDVHPAMYPEELPRRLVKLLTPPAGLVLDPFAGSGTTGVAAAKEGRRCLLIEKEPAYAAIARKRVAECLDVGMFAEAG